MEELKSCPFCETTDLKFTPNGNYYDGYITHPVNDCALSGRDIPIKQWNARPTPDGELEDKLCALLLQHDSTRCGPKITIKRILALLPTPDSNKQDWKDKHDFTPPYRG